MKRLLNYQADRIEMVLKSYNAPARVLGGIITPRSIQFRLLPRNGLKLHRLQNLAEEIALALGCPSCRIYRQGGAINLEIPRSKGRKVSLLPLCRRLPPVPPCTAVLGLEKSGNPLLLHLPSPDVAHTLIAGSTGSGKTALARTIISSLALLNRQSRVQIALIDPKRRGFAPFSTLPHLLRPLVDSPQAATQTLKELVSEMERRDRSGNILPRLVVFIDELADLLQQGGAETKEALTRLTQRGRSAGIHLVACTQKPTTTAVGSLIKSNFPARLVGSVSSAEDARIATGLPQTGAERLSGQGDFLVVVRGEIYRFQAAYISEREIKTLVQGLQKGEGRAALLSPPPYPARPQGLLTKLFRRKQERNFSAGGTR